MKITLRNIQSIENAIYEFPETGVVAIKGGNSNGKSILVKTLQAITSLKIMDKEVRRALVNDNCDEGVVVMEARGRVLIVKLNKEDRNSSYVALQRKDGTRIIRTLREGGVEELLHEFGFRMYNNNEVCLQIYETFGPMPFVNRSAVADGEIVEAHTEDSIAKDFMTKFKEITHKKAKTLVSGLNDKINAWEQAKATIILFDYSKYEHASQEMEKHLGILDSLDVIDLSELCVPSSIDIIDIPEVELKKIYPPPKVAVVDLSQPNFESMALVDFLTYEEDLVSMSGIVNELHDLLNGVCPTCGKLLLDKHEVCIN